MIVKLNGRNICNSEAVYGGPGHESTGPDGRVWETVSTMTECPPEIKVTKGDKLMIEAHYDTDTHPAYVQILSSCITN